MRYIPRKLLSLLWMTHLHTSVLINHKTLIDSKMSIHLQGFLKTRFPFMKTETSMEAVRFIRHWVRNWLMKHVKDAKILIGSKYLWFYYSRLVTSLTHCKVLTKIIKPMMKSSKWLYAGCKPYELDIPIMKASYQATILHCIGCSQLSLTYSHPSYFLRKTCL